MQKIGVFGASFNPPTRGHRDVIEQILPLFDEILLVPSLSHPFQKKLIPIEHRLEMLKIFVAPWQKAAISKVRIFNIESVIKIREPDKETITTYDVLQALEEFYQTFKKSFQLTFILGPDNAKREVWEKFYRYQDIEKRWTLHVVQERILIRSTDVRDIMKKNKDDPSRQEDALKQQVGDEIAHYILKHHLYMDDDEFRE